MKKIIIGLWAGLIAAAGLSAQPVTANLTIDNAVATGTGLQFDIYLQMTSALPFPNDYLYLDNADFILTFDAAQFNSPTLSKVGPASTFCTFSPVDPAYAPTVKEAYYNAISTSISGNELRINLNRQAPDNQTFFNQKMARIDGTAATHRLGRFQVSGISNPAGFANLQWKDTGSGVTTQVYTLANDAASTPNAFYSSRVLVNAINPANTPLPAELSQFDLTTERDAFVLTWASSQEKDLEYYTLERATDGLHFEPLSTVKASHSNGYQYTDSKVSRGITYYYRLKMTDTDGRSTWSPIRSGILAPGSNTVRVFPNPTTEILNIELDGREMAYVAIYDLAGKLMFEITDRTTFSNGINVASLPIGNYYLKINHEDLVPFTRQ